MRALFLFILLIVGGGLFQPVSGQSSAETEKITLIRIEGAISPLTTNYVKRGLEKAREQGSIALIIEMDTPGGLLESTKDIVQTMFDSDDMPIVVYVSPEGASAASAGTFITMAADIATMAPATNIGAASPVQMGGGEAQMDSVMQKKIFQHTESYIESIAKKRERNAEWAITAVRDGKSVTADKAVELNVVDFIAENRTDLLAQMNGMEVEGKILETENAQIETLPPNAAEKWLAILIRPEVILILTMLSIYGIIGEVTNPGAIIPGVAGVISLILVLFASAVIPLNTAGFILILIAVGLFVAEAFTPTFGILIAGGAVAFFLGGLMLFQDMPEPMSISFAWLIPSTIVMVLFFIWIAFEGIRIQFTDSATGTSVMVGKTARVVDDIDSKDGRVFVVGEYWNAVSDENLKEGEQCIILEVENLTLKVGKPPVKKEVNT
ncbi:MAG TPA: nodulation protein NfeD [Flavobacteriaceae bacterium]|nr:nodulation protein NfeD [Flavobacteriaceae bacterium]